MVALSYVDSSVDVVGLMALIKSFYPHCHVSLTLHHNSPRLWHFLQGSGASDGTPTPPDLRLAIDRAVNILSSRSKGVA